MIGVVSICLFVMSTSAVAFAEVDQGRATRAEELFREAHVLLKQARYRESCEKFAQSQQAEPASGTLLALAYCEEQDARLASAWCAYREAAELAMKEADQERQAAAAERASALLPRLSTLTVKVPQPLPPAADIRVQRDGEEIDQKLWGTAIPVDGGKHVLKASSAGRTVWSFTVTVRSEGDHQTVTVSELRLDQEPAAVAVPKGPAPTPRVVPVAPPPVQKDGVASPTALNRVGWGLAIASVASLGIGATLALVANSKNDRSNSDGHCDARGCDARGMQLRNGALSAASWATVSMITAGALAGSSITVFLVSDSKSRSAAGNEVRRSPFAVSGLAVSGRFQ
jgi:hypothetical protein